MTDNEARFLYESIMKQIAIDVKRKIDEMSSDVYWSAALKRREQGNEKAAVRLETHAHAIDLMLREAVNNNDIAYIMKNYPGVFYKRDGLFCTNLTLVDEATGDKAGVTFTGSSIKDVLKKAGAFAEAATLEPGEKTFDVWMSKSLLSFYRSVVRTMPDSEHIEMGKLAAVLRDALFISDGSVDEIADNVIRFDFGF